MLMQIIRDMANAFAIWLMIAGLTVLLLAGGIAVRIMNLWKR